MNVSNNGRFGCGVFSLSTGFSVLCVADYLLGTGIVGGAVERLRAIWSRLRSPVEALPAPPFTAPAPIVEEAVTPPPSTAPATSGVQTPPAAALSEPVDATPPAAAPVPMVEAEAWAPISYPQVLTGIPNLGNTCFLASLFQAWILPHEQGFREQRERETNLQRRIVLDGIVQAIESYKEAASQRNQFNILGFLCNVVVKNCPAYHAAKQQLEAGKPFRLEQEDVSVIQLWLADFLPFCSIQQRQMCELELPSGCRLAGPNEVSRQPFTGDLSLSVGYQCKQQPYRVTLKDGTSYTYSVTQYCVKQEENLKGMLQSVFIDTDQKGTVEVDRAVIMPDGNQNVRKCKVLSRVCSLSRPPEELMLTIQRFDLIYNEKGKEQRIRIQGEVKGLDLSMQIPGAYLGADAATTYDLVSCIVHEGAETADHGHYVAYVVSAKGEFLRLDDGAVTPQNIDQMQTAVRSAYKLFYVRSDKNPLLHRTV